MDLGEHQPMAKLHPLGTYIEVGLRRIGKNQTWLAEKLEVSNNAVSKWKQHGKIKRPNFLALIKLLGPKGAPDVDFDNELEPDEAAVLDFYRQRATEKDRLVMQIMAGYKAEPLLPPSSDTKSSPSLAELLNRLPGELGVGVSEEDIKEAFGEEKKKARRSGPRGRDD